MSAFEAVAEIVLLLAYAATFVFEDAARKRRVKPKRGGARNGKGDET